MYDSSKLPLADNLKNTKFIMNKAKAKNISTECEVGAITWTQYDIYSFEVGRQIALEKAELSVVICQKNEAHLS